MGKICQPVELMFNDEALRRKVDRVIDHWSSCLQDVFDRLYWLRAFKSGSIKEAPLCL